MSVCRLRSWHCAWHCSSCRRRAHLGPNPQAAARPPGTPIAITSLQAIHQAVSASVPPAGRAGSLAGGGVTWVPRLTRSLQMPPAPLTSRQCDLGHAPVHAIGGDLLRLLTAGLGRVARRERLVELGARAVARLLGQLPAQLSAAVGAAVGGRHPCHTEVCVLKRSVFDGGGGACAVGARAGGLMGAHAAV